MNYFKFVRENAGMSRSEAAKQLGISWFHLRNIETKQNNVEFEKYPSTELVLKMSKLYNCDATKLLEACNKEGQKILA